MGPNLVAFCRYRLPEIVCEVGVTKVLDSAILWWVSRSHRLPFAKKLAGVREHKRRQGAANGDCLPHHPS